MLSTEQKAAREPAAARDSSVSMSSSEQAGNAAARQRLHELLSRPFDVKSFALSGLFVLAVFYTIYFTRVVLLPVVLAILLSYLLAPVVRALARWHIAPLFGAGIVLAFLFGAAGVFVTRLVPPATAWIERAPYSFQRLQEKLSPLKKPIQRMTEAGAEIEKITSTDSSAQKKNVVEMKQNHVTDFVVTQTPEFLSGLLMIVILLYFLLAYDQMFLGKLVKVLPTLTDKKRALSIAHEIEKSISRYLVTVTCINLALGTAIGLAVFLLGLPNPALWGTMAFAFNFVPYLGATVGICAMTLGAVLSFDNLGWALVFPAIYLGLAILEGNFVTPFILGHSLTLNPIVIVLALVFWGWIWGIAGAILAVPILATFKIFCDHIEPLAPVGEFLST